MPSVCAWTRCWCCIACLALVVVALCSCANGLAPALPPEQPVFNPYATRGGAGGRVIRVTTLASSGEGSLRAALAAFGPRLVVFEVGGVIDLAGQPLVVTEPFVTVAGQTAPSPGITLIRGSLVVRAHDVIVQHLRVRPGDAGQPRRSGWAPDAISVEGANAYNVVIDHCSLTWAVDENLSASGPLHGGRSGTAHDVTFSYCLIAEALHRASHPEGGHSKGSLIHDHVTNVAIVGNLYAHNHDRNPYFKADTTGVVLNNLIYNPGIQAIAVNYVADEYSGVTEVPRPGQVAVVGNVLLHGRDTWPWVRLVSGRGEVSLEDNLALDPAGRSLPIADPRLTVLSAPPLRLEGVTPLPACEVASYVLEHAGARPRDRDAVDARIIEGVRQGTLGDHGAGIIDSQEAVGGYPSPSPVYRPLDVPDTGVEAWLSALAAELE